MVSRAKDTHTTNRVIRIPDEDWEGLGEVVGDRQRAETVRQLIRWYLRRPGAKLPRRPEPMDTVMSEQTANAWQVQMSRVDDKWIPMQPGGSRPIHGMSEGGDHWFTDHDEALTWARQLRNGLTWSAVRLVERDGEGGITASEDVL